jgi:hypothetical protein
MKQKTVIVVRKIVFSWNEMDEMYRVFARYFSLKKFVIFALCLNFLACVPEWEKINTDPTARLRFSSDTLFFDTLFVGFQSPTLRLKVYNPSAQSVVISSISLSPQSPFRLTVNGSSSQSHSAIRLLGKDSLLVLVSVLPSQPDTLFRMLEELVFLTNTNRQVVVLEGYGRLAKFLKDSILCNQVWKKGLPYVIREDILIDSLCTLKIEEGCQIYLSPGSDIFVKGSLQVLGSPQEPVVFGQLRQDPSYQNLPGQWNGITFLVGSKENLLQWAILKNAVNGFYLGTPDDDSQDDLLVRYCEIFNMSRNGFQAYNSDLTMENCLIHNCIEGTALMLIGGNYRLRQNTLANYGFSFFRNSPSFIASNFLPGGSLSAPLSLLLQNNIIWGSLKEEILFLSQNGIAFELTAEHNLLRTELSDLAINNNILNQSPRFANPNRFDYRLDTLSSAVNKGLTFPHLPIDLKGKTRTNAFDLGAYERE